MKSLLLYLYLFAVSTLWAQAPDNYYNNAQGKTGYELKTALKEIISNGYQGQSYGALIKLYETSDNDEYYDDNQSFTILDIYSENPTGDDPYFYFFNENCGNVGAEGTCYNREHLFPQGRFNRQEPMRSDAHHVVPTDGQVNGRRGSYPFGIVGNATYTSQNGSKVGLSITPGYTDIVFEPIDEFKGDIARSLLYFSTRYEDYYNDTSWDSPDVSRDPRDGSKNRWYEQWYIDLLLEWHNQDPVAARELERNNEIFKHQNNRNPFIDQPDYVNMIWSATASINEDRFDKVQIYPNPSSGTFRVSRIDQEVTIMVYDVTGRIIVNKRPLENKRFTIEGTGIYFVKLETNFNSKIFKVLVN